MSAAAIACSRGAAALGFRCRSLMRLPAAEVGCPRSNFSLLQRFSSQLAKSNGSRACLIDTLALVRRLEKEGVPTKQAEAITSTITEVLNESLENVAQSFVSKPEMQRSEMIQDSNLSKFKLEMKGSQDHHFALLQRETEKLRVDIDKMRSELRYEIDKVTAGQRLDLNLERGRIRDELAKQSAETTKLTTKLDRRQKRPTFARSRFHWLESAHLEADDRDRLVPGVAPPRTPAAAASRSGRRDRRLPDRGSPGRSPRIWKRPRRSPCPWSRRRGSR